MRMCTCLVVYRLDPRRKRANCQVQEPIKSEVDLTTLTRRIDIQLQKEMRIKEERGAMRFRQVGSIFQT